MLLLWPIDPGLVLHFGHNTGLYTKYTDANSYLPTQTCAHSYARTHTHTEVKQCRCIEMEWVSAAHAVPSNPPSKPLSQTAQLCVCMCILHTSLSASWISIFLSLFSVSTCSPRFDSLALSFCFNLLSFSAKSALMTSQCSIHKAQS